MPKPKFPKPWLRGGRGWYVTIGGKQIPLGENRESAFAAYHRLMQQPPGPKVRSDTIAAIIDQFLAWAHQHRAHDTFLWYQSRLQLFVDRYPDLTIGQLRPFHVQQWIDSFSHLSTGSKRNYCRAIQRALRWAEQQGIIDRSPIAHFEKPRAGKRDIVISPEEYREILGNAPNADFRDLVFFAWETGARAAECLGIERRHVEVDQRRIVFPRDEEKMRRAPRIIYLSDAALQIVRRRLLLPFNRLFNNSNGLPWSTGSVRMGTKTVNERNLDVQAEEIRLLIPKLRPTRNTQDGPVPKTPAELKEEARRKLRNRLASKQASGAWPSVSGFIRTPSRTNSKAATSRRAARRRLEGIQTGRRGKGTARRNQPVRALNARTMLARRVATR
jgi:integrase